MEQQSLGFALLNVWDWAHDPETDPPKKKIIRFRISLGKLVTKPTHDTIIRIQHC